MTPDIAAMPALMESLAILLLFFVLHLLVGVILPFRAARKPFLWNMLDHTGREVERRLNRNMRSASDRVVRGFVVVILVGFVTLAAGMALDALGHVSYTWLVGLAVLSATVSVMGPLKTLRAVSRRLEKDDVKGAAAALQPLSDADLSAVDAHGVVRAALECMAVRLNQYFVAPVMFYLFFQSAGLLFYVGMMALYDAFERTAGTAAYFSGTIRGLERILNFIPAHVTAVLIALSTVFVSGARPLRALRTARKHAKGDPSPNRGWLVAALAGALGVTLGGALRLPAGGVIPRDWMGPAGSTAQATRHDLQRGGMLYFVIFLCLTVCLSGLFMAAEIFP